MSGIPAMTYIEEQTVTFGGSPASITGNSIPLQYDGCIGFSFQNEWNRGGGTLAATITIEASNDPRAHPGNPDYSDAVWVDITATAAPTDATTGAGSSMENLADAAFAYVRQIVTSTAGAGLFKTTFTGYGGG